jgi:hypothetical protein
VVTCILISSEFDAAKSEVLEVVTDAVYLDHGDRLAIAGLGCPDVFADGGNGGLSGGADCGGIAGEGVGDGRFHFFELVGDYAFLKPWAITDCQKDKSALGNTP